MKYLESIFANIDEGLLILTPEGETLFFNESINNFHKALGWEPLALSKKLQHLIPEKEWVQINQAMEQVKKTGQLFYLVSERPTILGGHLVTESRYLPGRSDGVITHINIIIRDITATKIFEKRMAEQANEFRDIVEKANAVIMITDSRGYITDWNFHLSTITHYTKNEVLTRKMPDLLIPESDHRQFTEMFNRVLTKNPVFNTEVSVFSKDGRKLEFLLNVAPKLNTFGQVVGVVFIGQDITEWRKTERSLEEAQGLAHLGNWAMDLRTQQTKWSNETYHILGYNPLTTDASLQAYLAVIHPDDRDRVKVIINFSTKTFSEQTFYHRICIPRGVRHLLIKAQYEYDKNKIPIRLYGIMMDVTDITEKERELRQVVEELGTYKIRLEQKVEERTRELMAALKKEKDVVDMKTRFVSIASHEFRTPLSSIQHAIRHLRTHPSSPGKNVLNKLNEMEKQTNHMMFLLNDVLMYGKSEAGKIQLHLSPIKLGEFVERILKDVENVTRNTHRVKWSNPVTLPEIETDEKLLRNILTNLLSNAIKYSPGKKTVALQLEVTSDHIQFLVVDNGIGIPLDEQDRIFEAFTRGRSAASIPGTGLGLSIVKKAVELLQGSLELQSEVGRGTQIRVIIPRKINGN